MDIGIAGGGINGLCCAWVLQQQGHTVHLYERDRIVAATSSASSKLLHGGLRYLENREFRLVREALRERDAWLERVPQLTSPLRLVLPVYGDSRRPRWMMGIGLFLYDRLAGKSILPPSRWLSASEILRRDPAFRSEGLKGGYEFSDGQMDDHALGLWVAEQARAEGAVIHEQCGVRSVSTNGSITLEDGTVRRHDRVLNICGPWAERLLENSGIKSPYKLDLIRGSHLIMQQPCKQAYLLEVPGERRIIFVLPWKGQTLVGTTEVRQELGSPIRCADEEREYMLGIIKHYFPALEPENFEIKSFAGVRPLLRSADDPSQATREYALDRKGALISVFGGKWTTSHALARKVSTQIQ